MSHYRFIAFLSLDDESQGETGRQYPSGSHDLMIRCSRLDEPAVRKFFSVSIYRDDDQPLHTGDVRVLTTLEVLDDEVPAFLGPGQHFTLWNGHDCGRGVVSRRIFSPWAR